jgi:hypothetical protein
MGHTLKRFATIPCRTLNGEDWRNQFNLNGRCYICNMELGQRWLFCYFVWIVNFYNAKFFAFGFVFQHSTILLVVICAMKVLWWIKNFGICLLVFCFVPKFMEVIMSCLLDFGGVFWFCCGGSSHLLYVSKATWIGGAKYWCKWKVF